MKTPTKPPRTFIPESANLDQWETLEPLLTDLRDRALTDLSALRKWVADLSEFEAVMEEHVAWKYIKMTIDTSDEALTKDYQHFISEIQPKLAPFSDALNKKLVQNEFTNGLQDDGYKIYLNKLGLEIKIFREKNIELLSSLRQKSQEYGAATGGLSVEFKGETLTMPAAGAKLQETDRALRKEVFEAMHNKRAEIKENLDSIFNDLIKGRNEVALNADYKNFRDYAFDMLGRVDYEVQDCFNFHDSIASEISPLVGQFQKNRKEAMGVDVLKPYDTSVDPSGKAPLRPFEDAEDLINKSIEVFKRVDPYFGDCLSTMNTMGHLDLASKPGKAPGGYNYPLYEIGVPFIFMNAVGTQRDMVTMMHEGGHAVHSFLTRDLPVTAFKSCPSEVAELASMAMELLSMDHWDVFYDDQEELKRAKKDHLQDLLSVLPWIAIIDEFQHWIYENPSHSTDDRYKQWNVILEKYNSGVVDWTGYEDARDLNWQKQLHLFEVPFYYIEYGMAQLGAIAVYRNYRKDPKKAVEQYKAALELGYTKSIPEIYETAGIKFDFSQAYVRDLAKFIQEELAAIN